LEEMNAARELGAIAVTAIKNFESERGLRRCSYSRDDWCNGYLETCPKDWF